LFFFGSDLVDWLLNHNKAKDRYEAIQIGLKLQKYNLLHHVKDRLDFSDTSQLYRFRADDSISFDESVAKLATCDSKSGYLLKKGAILWNRRYFVLKRDEQKLYYFDTKLDSKPRSIIDLTCAECSISDLGDCKAGYYCFSIISCSKKYIICAENSRDQEDWIKSIQEGGALLKEEFNATDTKNSLFDYSAMNIDMEEVPMSQFAGKVIVIANVACY